MQGFSDKALILFPPYELYIDRDSRYKMQFRQAVWKLCAYLRMQGIIPHVFYTDDVAREVNHPDFTWVSTLSKADRFFASRNCRAMQDALTRSTVLFDDVYNEITAKDPGEPNMSVEERFEMVLRHNSKAAAKIIPLYDIVVHVRFKSKQQYRVASKAGDKKIRIVVDANTFLPTCYIGGMEVDACDLLQVPYGNRCLDVWEIDNG